MKEKKIPQRMCVGCQEMKNKKELVRVVRTPTDEVIIDPVGKKPGRGAYLCHNEQCLTKAVKEKRLERALKRTIDATIYETLKADMIHNE